MPGGHSCRESAVATPPAGDVPGRLTARADVDSVSSADTRAEVGSQWGADDGKKHSC